MIRLGFTGTRQGMTPDQLNTFIKTVRSLYHEGVSEFHHGDCIGADAEAHVIIERHASGMGEVYIHPPVDPTYRAFCNTYGYNNVITLPPKDYLERDRDIVDACDKLIACPKSKDRPANNRGSGTWYTIDYALTYTHKPVLIIYPDGTTNRLQRLN